MGKIIYDKLVRDGIRAKLEAKRVEHRLETITDPAEFITRLKQKVGEESAELQAAESREAFLSEYADLMVVLDALTAALEISPAELKLALEENIAAKGLFKAKDVLVWAEKTDH